MSSKRAHLTRFAPLLLAPALVSCVWILDFDSLQTEEGKGGSTSTGGSTGGGDDGGAGTGGTGACPSSCYDDDPCTVDGCTSDGECTRELLTGLVLDGVDETIPADVHYRTTMAAASDAFFLSSYSITGGSSEVTFYRLDANAPSDALSTIARLGELDLGDAVPRSAAGLAVDTALGRIHAFIGMENPNLGARLWHVVLDMNYSVVSRTAVLTGYGDPSPYNHPIAANIGGEIASAWINANGTASLWTGKLAGPAELAVGQTPMALALLATPDGEPLVLYGVNGGGVFVEGNGVPASAIQECQTRAGNYLSASATSVGVPGFWLAYWTKYGAETATEPGFLTTDGRGLACSALGCAAPIEGDCQSALSNAVRNVAVAIASRPGDPTGLVHAVQATPVVGPTEDGQGIYAGIILGATRIDFGPVFFETEAVTTKLGEDIVLSAMPTALPNLTGPDYPAVSYVPPDRFAVSWTQPSTTAGSELRIQRYRLCAAE
ncbi:MAG TPA: hypothetical protein VF103_13335 [Polyangiaceae bacterium]